MITAANPRPVRALTDRDLFDHSEQLVVLVVETHRVEARPRNGGLLKEPQLPPGPGGKVARHAVLEPRTA